MRKDVIPVVNGLFACLIAAVPLFRPTLPADTGAVRPPDRPARYFQVQLANDLYQGTDCYFTGGGLLRYVSPELGRAPLRRLLPTLRGATRLIHGVESVLEAFTPADISITEIQRDDRPYAGYWYAGQFLQSDRPGWGASLRAAVHVGVLGPAAAAGRVQTAIHQLIDCAPPAGWGHQVATDLVVDYQVQFRKRLLLVGQVLEAGTLAEARLGTLYDQLRTGAILRLGNWRPRPGKNFRCFGTWEGQLTGVGYNATFQGGMFHRGSPHTLAPDRLHRLVLGQTAMAVVQWGRVGISFGQTWLGREFHGGKPHCWNNLSIRVDARGQTSRFFSPDW